MTPQSQNLLTIDVGNSSTLIGVFAGDRLIETLRLPTLKSNSVQDWHAHLTSKITKQILQHSAPVIGTSVVPEANLPIEQSFSKQIQSSCRWITHTDRFNFILNIEQPHTVGTDRFVDACAAVSLFGNNVIVIDMGTATTVDCVVNGVFEGGLILPGLEISAQALFSKTSKLFPVTFDKPKSFIGKNTHDCIQSGLVNGYALMLDGIVNKMKMELANDLTVVSTGGLSRLMQNISKTIDHHDEFLTLKGLRSLQTLS